MIVGSAEYLPIGEIVGWALDSQIGHDRLLIEVFVGDSMIGVATADLRRTDRQPDTDGHGFRITLRRPLPEDAIGVLAVYATALSGERAPLSMPPESSAVRLDRGPDRTLRPAAADEKGFRAPAVSFARSPAAIPSARRQPAKSDMDIFVHIPKSGGSTIRTILSRQYGPDHILYVEDGVSHDSSGSGLTTFIENALSKSDIHLMTGHHRFGLHAIIKRYCRYFSMLRDPIDRALSDYFYAHSSETHRHRQKIVSGELTAAEYLTNRAYGFQGEQTRLLAAPGASENSSTRAAIENARLSFCLVGVTERFDESILLLAKILGWQPPIYVPVNRTRLDPGVKAERDRARADAHAWCANSFKEDYAVYTAVDQMLSARIRDEGEPFARALTAFREIQADISAWAGNQVYEFYDFSQGDLDPGLTARYAGSDPYRRILDYLASDVPLLRQRNYVGNVDCFDENKATGWAADLSRDEPIEVSIQRDGEVVQHASCALRRTDLAALGHPRTNLGFEIQLDQPVRNPNDYAICFEETSIRLPGNE